MRRARPVVLFAVLAAAVELAAVCAVLAVDTPVAVALGTGLHVIAALLALLAARARRRDLSEVEQDLVFTTALFVPVFGPGLAWCMPHLEPPETVENAHEVFVRYADHVKPAAPDYERTLFTGDYEKDLARELDAESYHEVLRHGATDQKRNALRRLAGLGEKKHFTLIRRCLLDPEHEVRLYAYSELERAGRVYEEEIAKRTRQLGADGEQHEAKLALAQAYYDYAESGIHDEEMAAFYFRSAHSFAAQVRGSAEAVWLRAGALARLEEYERADEVLALLGEREQALARSCLVRADLAYRRRDFVGVRREAERLKQAGGELPDWLTALGVKP